MFLAAADGVTLQQALWIVVANVVQVLESFSGTGIKFSLRLAPCMERANCPASETM